MGNETVETCVGIFVDAGNSTTDGNPYPDANFTYTICPTTGGRRKKLRPLVSTNPTKQQRLPVHLRRSGRRVPDGQLHRQCPSGLPVTATVNNPTGCPRLYSKTMAGYELAPDGGQHILHHALCGSDIGQQHHGPAAAQSGLPVHRGLPQPGNHLRRCGSVRGPRNSTSRTGSGTDDGTIDTLTNAGNVTHNFDEPENTSSTSPSWTTMGAFPQPSALQVLVSTIPCSTVSSG